MQFAISASRVYNLNHFPHQCIVGLFFGAAVVRNVYCREDFWTSIRPRKKTLLAVNTMFLGVPFALYFGMMRAGVDPGDKAATFIYIFFRFFSPLHNLFFY